MKQMLKTNKFVKKDSIYAFVQNQVSRTQFDQEIAKLLEDGTLCQAFDDEHFCLIEWLILKIINVFLMILSPTLCRNSQVKITLKGH